MKNTLILLILSSFLFACSSNCTPEKISKEDQEKADSLQKVEEETIEELGTVIKVL